MNKKILIFFLINSLIFTDESIESKKTLGIHLGSSNSKFISKQFQGLTNSSVILNPIFKGNKNKFDYEIDIFLSENKLIARQLYLKLNYNDSVFFLGRFHPKQSSEDSIMSSGSMIESGNALGIPRIGSITEKKYNNHKISFTFFHGQLNRNKYLIEKPFLHEKKLYYSNRILNNKITIGLSHSVIWGGETTDNGKQPERFEDFIRAVFGNPGDDNATTSDQINALGESVGMWDFSFERKFNNFDLKLYHQNFFEDGSGLSLNDKLNGFDGLWGIQIKKNYIKTVYEYLKTTYQGGDMHPPGLDSFYWSGAYRPGWVFNGQTIGNMIISPQNNRVKSHFLSIGIFENENNYTLLSLLYSNQFLPYTGNTLNYDELAKNFSNSTYKELSIIYKKQIGRYDLHTYFGSNLKNENVMLSLFYNF